jgi:S-sulfo-L-cysteine synthase (O-acetyl-L-serine-dependent)
MNFPTIEECIGNTPLVRLQRLPGETSNRLLVKLEGNNPAGSVKDRPALNMIRRAEERGEIRPGDTLIEATSGNTGIALAMAAAIKGYRMVLVMPEHMSVERRALMRAYGAEIVLTPRAGQHGGGHRPRPGDGGGGPGPHPRPVRQPGQPGRP